MAKVFIEVCAYHAETLYPYIVNLAKNEDIVLYNFTCPGAETIETLPQEKFEFSLFQLLKILITHDITAVHINSVSVNLHAGLFFPAWSKTLKIILIPYLCRLFGVTDIQGIVHEADQYFSVNKVSNKRHIYYQKFFGRFHIKLFSKLYVLSPEVKKYLKVNTSKIEVLSTRPLVDLYLNDKSIKDDALIRCVWIGPVKSYRRNWKSLLMLDKDILKDNNVVIDMVCDIRSGEGEALRKEIEQLGLAPYFKFREYRPDDVELYSAVRSSALVLCLYANNSYGSIKTSGARHIALAFDKPCLIFDGEYKVLNSQGLYSSSFNDISKAIINAMGDS
mgnify:CR=1 FL=1